MSNHYPDPRPLSASVDDVPRLLSRIEGFLGKAPIRKKLERIEQQLEVVRPGIFREHWILPRCSWWLVLADMLRLREKGRSLPRHWRDEWRVPLELAGKLEVLIPSMPQDKREEIRSRLLKADYLAPVIFEIDAAAHYWQCGYEIEWISAPREKRARHAEFIAHSTDESFEVECKARGLDAGRSLSKERVLGVADEIDRVLRSHGLHGEIHVDVPSMLPAARAWIDKLLQRICLIDASSQDNTVEMDDGTLINAVLHPNTGELVRQPDFWERLREIRAEFGISAGSGAPNCELYTDPIYIAIASRRPDRVLEDTLDDLRKANKQLSGSIPGVICCFVPEISSFEGLESNSGLAIMVSKFFENHAKPWIRSIEFVSEAHVVNRGTVSSSTYPRITLNNPWHSDSSVDSE